MKKFFTLAISLIIALSILPVSMAISYDEPRSVAIAVYVDDPEIARQFVLLTNDANEDIIVDINDVEKEPCNHLFDLPGLVLTPGETFFYEPQPGAGATMFFAYACDDPSCSVRGNPIDALQAMVYSDDANWPAALFEQVEGAVIGNVPTEPIFPGLFALSGWVPFQNSFSFNEYTFKDTDAWGNDENMFSSQEEFMCGWQMQLEAPFEPNLFFIPVGPLGWLLGWETFFSQDNIIPIGGVEPGEVEPIGGESASQALPQQGAFLKTVHPFLSFTTNGNVDLIPFTPQTGVQSTEPTLFVGEEASMALQEPGNFATTILEASLEDESNTYFNVINTGDDGLTLKVLIGTQNCELFDATFFLTPKDTRVINPFEILPFGFEGPFVIIATAEDQDGRFVAWATKEGIDQTIALEHVAFAEWNSYGGIYDTLPDFRQTITGFDNIKGFGPDVFEPTIDRFVFASLDSVINKRPTDFKVVVTNFDEQELSQVVQPTECIVELEAPDLPGIGTGQFTGPYTVDVQDYRNRAPVIGIQASLMQPEGFTDRISRMLGTGQAVFTYHSDGIKQGTNFQATITWLSDNIPDNEWTLEVLAVQNINGVEVPADVICPLVNLDVEAANGGPIQNGDAFALNNDQCAFDPSTTKFVAIICNDELNTFNNCIEIMSADP